MDREKLKVLISGLLKARPALPKVKLAKLILFAEIEYYRKYGESFTGLYFVRVKMGPVIAFFDEVLAENEGTLWSKKAEEVPIYSEGRTGIRYAYSPLKDLEIPESLNEILETVSSTYGEKSGTRLSAASHNLPAWKYSEPNEPLYVSELSIENEDEYFAVIDLVENLDEGEDESLPEEVLGSLRPGKK